ncbi:unnamed protein product [Acanthoscelides obtectus]|uniref:Uncharacterized protein n=2 Tax=Acanthoscelides obtectus TaxID=200917 RepID=A0A9P0JJ92_ACAOB|nr:unnamed protein product [Acanthoscelides obtectus]CAK1639716.1 hypothetical protein AOBTE_LOCUS11328 [Acanthoscelides obtectus]
MNIKGFGVTEIRNKIRILRSTYSQVKHKILTTLTKYTMVSLITMMDPKTQYQWHCSYFIWF